MSARLSFELLLLNTMSEAYRASVLREIMLTEAEASKIRAQCQLKLPAEVGSDLVTYIRILGPEVENTAGYRMSGALAGSTAHCFILTLWPHLFWVVHRRPDGTSWEVGFQNQAVIDFKEVEPSTVRVGLWTRTTLEHIADRSEVYDGWDEQVVVRFDFGDRRYEGEFVFGLLQEWRQL